MIIKATAGCYVDSTWGQYGPARMIQRATEFGYTNHEAEDLASRKLAEGQYLSNDEHWKLIRHATTAEDWLNDNVAPDDYYFGWSKGEFVLQSSEWWDEDV